MRRFVIAGLVLAAAAAAGTAMAGGLLSGGKAGHAPGAAGRKAAPLASCHCQRGPRGEKGAQGTQGTERPAGPQGPQGASGTGLFAVVNIDGTVFNASGVAGVTHDGVGSYTVTFTKIVDGCAAVATVGGHQTSSIPLGFAALSTFDRKVVVATWRFTDVGSLPMIERADKGFHLEVSC
jgi:hypothetical protein